MEKSRVLVVGGTGYIGRRIVKASLELGHPTYVLLRPEIGLDIEKLQMLLSCKAQGARLVEASLDDHRSLVAAVKQVDVVVSAMSGVHFRSHNLLLQLKLVEAIKEAGNVKRFIPSEFGMDPSRMGHALEPGRVSFDEKMQIRRAIEEAKIFVWLLYQDRLQTAVNLKMRMWKGNENCILCGVKEDSNHIFFDCVLATFVWTFVKGCLHWKRIPTSLDDFHQFWLNDRGANDYQIILFSFAALVWTLWKVRNKMAIEKTFPKQPVVVIFKSLSCLQRWRVLLKEKDRQCLDDVIKLIEDGLKNLK